MTPCVVYVTSEICLVIGSRSTVHEWWRVAACAFHFSPCSPSGKRSQVTAAYLNPRDSLKNNGTNDIHKQTPWKQNNKQFTSTVAGKLRSSACCTLTRVPYFLSLYIFNYQISKKNSTLAKLKDYVFFLQLQSHNEHFVQFNFSSNSLAAESNQAAPCAPQGPFTFEASYDGTQHTRMNGTPCRCYFLLK